MNRMTTTCIAAIAAVSSVLAADPEGFGAKQTITFSGYDGATSLENFPALIRLSSVYFRQADGSDVVVTDADGNILPHEVDSVMDGKVLVWVRVPSLSGTATSVTAWFGKDGVTQTGFAKADVWTNAYAAVWHLNADAVDSTGHGLAQTVCDANAQTAIASNGLLGRGFKLGTGDKSVVWLRAPSSSSGIITNVGTITVSGWVKPAAVQPSGNPARIFSWKSAPDGKGFDTYQTNANGHFYIRGDGNSYTWQTSDNVPWLASKWSHMVIRLDGKVFKAFCNGSEMASGSGAASSEISFGTENFGFGNFSANNNNLRCPLIEAELDEFRVYNGVASVDWIRAEYRTVADSAFAQYGAVVMLESETWTSGKASANWSAPANWADGIVSAGYKVVFSSPSATTEQTVDLGGGEVAIGSVVQSDSTDRTLANGTLAFGDTADFDIETSNGRLELAEAYSSDYGLLKKGAGTLAFAKAFNILGDATVSGGTLALAGGAATEGFTSGETSLTPTNAMLLTHVGIPDYISLPARAYVRSSGNLIAEMRFTAEAPGFVRNGFRYLRLPESITLSAGTTYASSIYDIAVGQEKPGGSVLVAAADGVASIGNVLTVADQAAVSASSAVVQVHGLDIAGGISAAEGSPVGIDATIATSAAVSGSTAGPVGLIKRGAGTLTLSGENLFADGITCREGMVVAATGSTVSPSAPLVFGDRTGSNKCGGFTVLADNATVSNAMSVTSMTTTGLSDQGIYAQPGSTLTVKNTTVSDIDKWSAGRAPLVPGQFAVHAHADPDGAVTRLVFRDSTVEYLDFTARIDGIADQLQARPSNEVVIDSVEAPNKIRKFVVQNSVPYSLGGTVTFAGTTPLVVDWFDIVGNGTRVVQAPGTSLQVDKKFRFNFFGQAITQSGVDWTIGNGATLAANGFPFEVANNAVPTESVLHLDGGTLKMSKRENGSVRLFNLDPPYELGVDVSANGGVIDLVPAGGGTANAVTIDRAIGGAGAMTIKGDASLPAVTLEADVTAAGGLVADAIALDVTSGVRRIAALASEGGASVGVADGATLALSLGSESGSFAGKVDVASGGTVCLAARGPAETMPVSDGGFEVEPVLSGGQGDLDKRSDRDDTWLSTYLPAWTFGEDNDASGICVNGSFFSNNLQINNNGEANYYAAFLRKVGDDVGPGLISRTVSTTVDNSIVKVEFQFAARWFPDSQWGRPNGWAARVGVLLDGVQVHATDTIHSSQTNFKVWHTCAFEIPVASAGAHTLAFTALDPDGAYEDDADGSEALLDNVKVGVVAPIGGDRAQQFGSLKLDLAAGAKLNLDSTVSDVKIRSLVYAGQKVLGRVSKSTCPFVTGDGSLSMGCGLILMVK